MYATFMRENMPDQTLTRFLEIQLPIDPPFSNYSLGKTRGLGPLSLINIFIGANNSGKSRLLRALFSLKDLGHTTNIYSADIIYNLINEAKTKLNSILSSHRITGIDGITSAHFDDILKFDPHFVKSEPSIYKLTEEKLKAFLRVSGGTLSYAPGVSYADSYADRSAIVSQLQTLGNETFDQFNKHKPDSILDFKKRYYIPILRGMRPLDDKQTDFYKTRTATDYFSNSPLTDQTKVFTGIELYQTLKNKLLGEPEDREAVRDFENFLSKKFFKSQQITLIPREGDTTVHVKIGKEKQLPIYQLGDGLQNLIICVFNIFMEKDRCLFFIEEPDICMHPSLQRSFLEVISAHKKHQYFITTHSNHLLDMTLDFSDISVFHFSKVEDDETPFPIKVTSSHDHNLLRDIGVRNSSVFLTNATIWVEGITDRLYLRTYMAKYCKEIEEGNKDLAKTLSNLKEDLHYSFVEYQGTNLTHWSFDPNDEDTKRMKATYVCAHAFLIADGDISGKGNREEIYKAMLGDRFFILNAKEIENFIPPEVLKLVVAKRFEELGKNVDTIKYEEYSKTEIGLGTYLDGILGQAKFAADSGTIKPKVSFCEKAIEIMNNPEIAWSLTPELKDLCKRIYDHILKENPD